MLPPMRKAPVAEAIAPLTLSLATLVLGESITLPLVLGAAFILAGMLMGQFKPSARPRECPDDVPCG